MATPDDYRIKGEFIRAYFESLEERIRFAKKLHDEGRHQEAMLLCCCYLDGLGNWQSPDDDAHSHQNFVEVVRSADRTGFLARVNVSHLKASLARLKSPRVVTGLDSLRDADESVLYTAEELIAVLRPDASSDLVAWLGGQLWRGTVASIAYQLLRVPAVHRLGSAGSIGFEGYTMDGSPAPAVTFGMLHSILVSAVESTKAHSTESNQWFGQGLRFAEGN